MFNRHFIVSLRQRLAAHGIHPAPSPASYPHHADVPGLTPSRLGYDRCAQVLGALRDEAEAATGGSYALSVLRDPLTGERRGYRVHAYDPATAASIAQRIAQMVP